MGNFDSFIELGLEFMQLLKWISNTEQKRWLLEKLGLVVGFFLVPIFYKDPIKIQEKDNKISIYTNVKDKHLKSPKRVKNNKRKTPP